MKKKIVSTIFVATIFSMTSFCIENYQEQIVDFVYERDVKDVFKIIHDDWDWLFRKDLPNYDPNYILQYEIPNKELLAKYGEKLKMKVFREKERVIGFVTFYKEDSDVGRVRLISVSQDFSEKECGKKLTIAAVNALFDLGCTSAYLFTYKKNEKVLVYENLGFKEGMTEDVILWFKEAGVPIGDVAQYWVNKETFKPCDQAVVEGLSSK